MLEYMYLIHPLQHQLASELTPTEEAIRNEHLFYLQHAAAQGNLMLAGLSLDGVFEVVIFRAENEQAAETFMFNDPVVKRNIMVAELHPFKVSLIGNPL